MDSTGLAATTWDNFAGDGPFCEHDLFLRLIQQSPGKVLDVGFGTGRLMLSYLAAGIDVEGVDSSGEMLAICRQKAFERGLSPVLYQQRMQALDLGGRY